MRIGLCLPHFGRPLPGRLLQVAQRADAQGLDSLWVTETIDVLAREIRPALGA